MPAAPVPLRDAAALRLAERIVGALEAVGAAIAVAILAAIMLIVSVDVAMRYVFNRPLGWSYDLISLYLMGALFYLSAAGTFTVGAHIGVDVLQPFFGARLRRVMQIISALLAAAVFALIAALVASRTQADFVSGAASAGDVLWPTWLAEIAVPIGSLMLCLRLLVHAAGHALSLATGRDIVKLPALPGAKDAPEGFE